jgi:hypothetical protein
MEDYKGYFLPDRIGTRKDPEKMPGYPMYFSGSFSNSFLQPGAQK